MDIYNKPKDSTALFNKDTVLSGKKNMYHCWKCKRKCFKELKKIFLQQKYPKSLIEASILRAKEIPLEVLRQPKTTKSEEIIPLIMTYNPNNPNAFPLIK